MSKAALERLSRNDPLGALDVLVEQWAEAPGPELAQLITVLGTKVAVDPAPAEVLKLKPKALYKAIVDLCQAAQPEHVHDLAPLVARVIHESNNSWPVVEVIVAMRPDPRFAEMALGCLKQLNGLTSSSAKLWRRLVSLLERHGHAGLAERLEAVPTPAVGPFSHGAEARRRTVANKLRARNTHFIPSERAALEAAVQRVAVGPVQRTHTPLKVQMGDALLRAVYANPNDDHAKTVYADWLAERGDPRGEFIQLQLQRAAGDLTPKQEQRERALLLKHARAWLSELAPIIDQRGFSSEELPHTELEVPPKLRSTASFEKGFLSQLVLREKNISHLESLMDHPSLATVHTIYAPLRFSAVMRGLRHAYDCSNLAFKSLVDTKLVLESLHLSRTRREKNLNQPFFARTLRIDLDGPKLDGFEVLADAVEGDQTLESICIGQSRIEQWSHWQWRALEGAPSRVRELKISLVSEPPYPYPKQLLTFHRRDDGRWSTLTIEGEPFESVDELRPWASALRGPIQTVKVEIEKPLSPAVRKVLLAIAK